MKTKLWRRWYCARIVPPAPAEAPMIAAGFPLRTRSPVGGVGREAQSRAFFNTPGTL
jgi:hypothetical protein